MLTMVNSSEHQSNPTMATTDAYLHQQASHTQQEPQPEPHPQPQPQSLQQQQQCTGNDENVEPRQRNIPVPVLVKHEEYAGASAMLQVSLSFASSGGDQSGEESSGSMRSATTPSSSSSSKRPREKRSTKSKCPPGLRSGKWTLEEEAFTNMIIYYFKLGRLHVEDGTSLRWYLAKRLNCEAMRVTKKLKGNSSIGKQIFRALEDTEESRRAIAEAAEALAVVEKAFVDSLSATGQSANSSSNSNPNQNAAAPVHASASVSAAIAAAARSKKSSPHKPVGVPKPPHLEARKLVIPKVRNSLANSEDAKLLMHFFVEAHDPNMEKKRLFSDVDTSPSASSTSSSSQADDASPASKRRSVKMEDLVVGTI